MITDKKKNDTLIIASNLTEASFLLLEKMINGKSYLFLAIDPTSQILLKTKDKKYLTSRDFFDSKTDKVIISESYKILKKYENGINLIQADGIDDCFKNYINFNFILKIREWVLIHEMIKEINIKEIIYSGSDNFIFSILLRWTYSRKISLRSIKNLSQKTILKRYKRKVFNFFRIIIFELLLLIYKLFFNNQNKNKIFITGTEYNLAAVINKTKDFTKDFLPVYLTSSTSYLFKNKSNFFKGNFFSFQRVFGFISPKYKKDFILFKAKIDKAMLLFEEMETKSDNKKYLYAELNNFIYHFLKYNCLDLFRSYIGLKKIFENNTSNIFVIAQHALGFNGLVGEMSNNQEISSMLITHGSHVKQSEKYTMLGWDEINKTLINAKFTFSAMQTPLAYNYFMSLKNKKAKPIITGPMIFGLQDTLYPNTFVSRDIMFKENSRKFIFLHAGTPKQWNAFRPVIYESIDDYITNLIDVINVVKKNKKIFLAIRYRPIKDLSLSLLKQFLPEADCYKIYTDGIFYDYLQNSDFLISYSSTTIEEALMNKKPVLLYNPKGHYFHISGQVLDKNKYPKTINTVYNLNSKNNLSWSLDWLISNHKNKNKNKVLNWDQYSFNKNETNSYQRIIEKKFKFN